MEEAHIMKLNILAFGLAVGSVVAVAFTICAFFVALAPEATAAFIGYLPHINLSGLTRPISWGNYFVGVLLSVYGQVYGLLLLPGSTIIGLNGDGIEACDYHGVNMMSLSWNEANRCS
jgi:hypothetical protein